jgi:hypothetical protein
MLLAILFPANNPPDAAVVAWVGLVNPMLLSMF